MTKISGSVVVRKRILPAISATMLLLVFFSFISSENIGFGSKIFLGVFLIGVAGFYYVAQKFIYRDLVDEVFTDGDSILVRKDGVERRIFLKEIAYLYRDRSMYWDQYIIQVKSDLSKGKQITFLPRNNIYPFNGNSHTTKLIKKIKDAKIT